MALSIEEAFRILEVQPSASWEEVKQTYRELAKVWHPDRFHDDEKFKARATKKIQDINAAYQTLEKHFENSSTQPSPIPTQKPQPPPNTKEASEQPEPERYVTALTPDDLIKEAIGTEDYYVFPCQIKSAPRYRQYLEKIPVYLAVIGWIFFFLTMIYLFLIIVVLLAFLGCLFAYGYCLHARLTDPKKIRPDALVFTTENLIVIQWVLEDQATKLHKAKNITQIPWPYVQKVESSLDKLTVQVSDNSVCQSIRLRISPRQTVLNHRDVGYYKKNVMTRREALDYIVSRGNHVK